MNEIEQLLREYTTKIQEAARREAAATVAKQMEAVTAQFVKAGTVLVGLGKRKGSKRAAKPGKRARRSPEQLEAQAKKIMTYVGKKSVPAGHRRVDWIANATGMTVGELQSPIALLKSSNRIRTQGTKRSTTYWPT